MSAAPQMAVERLERLDPEPVIVSLNTELYAMKCLILTLQLENMELKAALDRFRRLAKEI